MIQADAPSPPAAQHSALPSPSLPHPALPHAALPRAALPSSAFPRAALPHPASQRAGLGQRLLEEGRRLLLAGKPAEALPLLRTAATGMAEAAAWVPMADALLALGEPQAALDACDGAADEVQGSLALLLSRARALGRLGRPREALENAASAVLLAPRDDAARIVLGQALLASERHDEAISVLGEVWREAPEEPGGALRLADAMMRAGRHDAVAELLAFMLDGLAMPEASRRLALGLRAQNALLRGQPEAAVDAALAGLAGIGADAALHSIAAHALIKLGRRQEARGHLMDAHRLAPEDAYLAHLAASLDHSEQAPDRAAAAYVTHLFEGYAAGFEASLLGLGYRVPGLILRALEGLLPGLGPDRKLGDVLDLGCGTGLIGVVLHDLVAGQLKGVDLSPAMLAQARLKGVYTSLEHADIDAALARDAARYEVVIAADVFCYLGALEATLAAIAPRLAPGGLLLFTVEASDDAADWALNESGRYRHSEAGLRRALAAAGLAPLLLRREALRLESDAALAGFLVAAQLARAGA